MQRRIQRNIALGTQIFTAAVRQCILSLEKKGGLTWPTSEVIQLVRSLLLLAQLRYADERTVNIMKVYIEMNNLQL